VKETVIDRSIKNELLLSFFVWKWIMAVVCRSILKIIFHGNLEECGKTCVVVCDFANLTAVWKEGGRHSILC
jgi:hypothetical protein